MKPFLPDFLVIPYQLLNDDSITLTDERLYAVIYWFTKLKNERCTASNETLAKLIKSTPQTVKNSLTKLEQRKYIKRIMDDQNHRKEIIPLLVFARVDPSSIDDGGSLTSDGGVTEQGREGSLTSDQNKNTKNKNTKEHSPALCATTGGPDESFEEFWRAYPRKTAKVDAARSWNRLKPTVEVRTAIIAAVESWKRTDQWQREQGRFIPHPATFLNQRRWEDEIITEAAPSELRVYG